MQHTPELISQPSSPGRDQSFERCAKGCVPGNPAEIACCDHKSISYDIPGLRINILLG